jgi:thiol-disulfide isomerase/thioredoxin
MLSTDLLAGAFSAALPYSQYLDRAKPQEAESWNAFHARVRLSTPQVRLLESFTRAMPVLCVSGSWCGDCVQQVPMLEHIARASRGKVDLRLLERDAHKDFASGLKICGGDRVPVVVFMNEDHEFVALAGDRTLARYRALAARALGPSCPLPGAPVPDDEVAATLQDWVDQFERVQLLLRLSGKLRARHGD